MPISRKKKHSKIFAFNLFAIIMACPTIAYCQPENTLPLGDYQLEITSRPSAPYPAMDNYNSALTESGIGSQYTVQVSRHHIIPFNVLRTFFNRVSEQHAFVSARGFMMGLADNIGFYASTNYIDCSSRVNDFVEAENLAQALGYGFARAGGSRPPLGFDTFEEFYTWLPGNLFIGPNNRSDDPGEGFENNAYAVVGIANFSILKRLYRNMVRYNDGDELVLNSVISDLMKLIRKRSVYQLNPDNWNFVNGSYYLRTDNYKAKINIKQKKQTDKINSNFNTGEYTNDQCAEIKPTLVTIISTISER